MKVNCLKDSDKMLTHPAPKRGMPQMDLSTMFLELPRTIDLMLEERRMVTPIHRPDKRIAVSTPNAEPTRPAIGTYMPCHPNTPTKHQPTSVGYSHWRTE